MANYIDILIDYNDDGFLNPSFTSAGDFELDESLDTGIITSLFTEARADESQVTDNKKRSGWVGSEFIDDNEPSFNMGSYIWLLDQARLTQSTINNAIDYAQLSLEWSIDQGYFDTVIAEESSTSYVNGLLTVNLDCIKNNNTITEFETDIVNNSAYRN